MPLIHEVIPGFFVAFTLRPEGDFRTHPETALSVVGVPKEKKVICAQLVHGVERFLCPTALELTKFQFKTSDALLNNHKNIALMMRTADCVPMYIVEPKTGAFALVHGGWRSLVQGIVELTLLQMKYTYGFQYADVHVWLGPSIQAQSYTSESAHIQQKLSEWQGCVLPSSSGKSSLNLQAHVTQVLQKLGVPLTQIIDSKLDTYPDAARFFSYRRAVETAQPAEDGRHAVIAWRT